MLSPDPFLVPWPDFEEADQALDISDSVLERSTTEAQDKLRSESLDVNRAVSFGIPDQTVK